MGVTLEAATVYLSCQGSSIQKLPTRRKPLGLVWLYSRDKSYKCYFKIKYIRQILIKQKSLRTLKVLVGCIQCTDIHASKTFMNIK